MANLSRAYRDLYDSDLESYQSSRCCATDDGGDSTEERHGDLTRKKYRYRKSLVPNSDKLQSLQLQDGENELSFQLGGECVLKTRLFLWEDSARLVLADIEGVMTRSEGPTGWGRLLAPQAIINVDAVKVPGLCDAFFKANLQFVYYSF
jgi:phosphatidate phosphatase PAH1